MVLILIFAEVLGLYGSVLAMCFRAWHLQSRTTASSYATTAADLARLIIALILNTNASG